MRAEGDAPVTVSQLTPPKDYRSQLLEDVLHGFTGYRKYLPSKYFYDGRGSELFEQITELPEYYLTRAETEILAEHADSLMARIQPDELVELGVSCVGVCLLHSYANPEHEEHLAALLAGKFPFVAISSRVNPEAREFERTATTVLSAGVMPLTRTYLDNLEAEKPPRSRLHLFHSSGGMASPDAMRDLPLGLALSGPAAGVAAAMASLSESAG